jgi:dUTP pyrophosphatase
VLLTHVRIRRIRPERDADLPSPAPATTGSAGADLVSALEEELVLLPGERTAIPTGFAVEIPFGYEGQVRMRSGLALHYGLYLPNAPGTIDADYRGEIRVLVQNGGGSPVNIMRGDRIAQLVIAPVAAPAFEEVPKLAPTTRGSGGFGHTGGPGRAPPAPAPTGDHDPTTAAGKEKP